MGIAWFKPRNYRHFDVPVGEGYARQVMSADFVSSHSWSPLISYIKKEKRYNKENNITATKSRQIMYASHRDACILSFYADELSKKLEQEYQNCGLGDNVIAYRSLGKSNYDFTANALDFAEQNAPCKVICFDVTKFFDNIDHAILKRALIKILNEDKLSDDWYKVFRAVTRYRHIELENLKAHPNFGLRIKKRSRSPIATIAELKSAGIAISANLNRHGIPQGTPISANLSNLYMLELDQIMARACKSVGALYQRYSDDILIICETKFELMLNKELIEGLNKLNLQIKVEKTERAVFGENAAETFQYLGFNVSPNGAIIRPSSIGRQWRKAKRAIRRTSKKGKAAIASGSASKVYTKSLRRRFSPVGARNFSSYARRAADALHSEPIRRQVRRWERMVERELEKLK